MMTDRGMRTPELERLSQAMIRGEMRPVLDGNAEPHNGGRGR